MYKRLILLLICFVLCGFFAFGQDANEETESEEEVGFLLFSPNSSSEFANPALASRQLNNLARFLRNRNLSPGQVHVYGYAADFQNEIEPEHLSHERAVFIITELQGRGVNGELFSEPVAYGAVQTWDDRSIEDAISPNRRVRIVLGGENPTYITMEIVDQEIEAATIITFHEEEQNDGSGFPWWLLLLLLLPLLLLLLRKKKPGDSKPKPKPAPKPVPAPAAAAAPTVATHTSDGREKSAALMAAETESGMDLTDLIRRRAYQLFEGRGYQHGCHDEDWYNAERDILEWYERYKKDKSIGPPFGLEF